MHFKMNLFISLPPTLFTHINIYIDVRRKIRKAQRVWGKSSNNSLFSALTVCYTFFTFMLSYKDKGKSSLVLQNDSLAIHGVLFLCFSACLVVG